jgi:ribosome recycling factor
MKIEFSQADQKFADSLEFLKRELQSFRVGRGSLQLIEGVKAEVYGQFMPINQLANINMVDATLVTISPWDKNNLQPILKALQSANTGINPVIDGEIVRLPIPPMTEERRKEYVKALHEKLEETRITIRDIRKDILTGLEDDKKSGELPEDDFTRMEKDLQKKVDNANQAAEKIAKDKEAELMQV